MTIQLPEGLEVQPLAEGEPAERRATCGNCGLSWDDGKVTSITPTPAGRCPFEPWHDYEDEPVTRYTIQAGRGILCDGVHIVSIQRNEGFRGSALQMARNEHGHPIQNCDPCRADDLARRIVDLLNEHGEVTT